MIYYKNLKKLVLLLINSSQFSCINVILSMFFEKAYELAQLSYLTDTSIFFKLFKYTVTTALENPETFSSFDFSKQAYNICDILLNPVKFQRDITMFIGSLKIMNLIIRNNPHLNYKIGFEKNLLSVLIEQYLFNETKLHKLNIECDNHSDLLLEDIDEKTILCQGKIYDDNKSIKTIYSTISLLLSNEPKNIEKFLCGIFLHIISKNQDN
jgi:hypothetical protein